MLQGVLGVSGRVELEYGQRTGTGRYGENIPVGLGWMKAQVQNS
jgi:hypothetical protein